MKQTIATLIGGLLLGAIVLWAGWSLDNPKKETVKTTERVCERCGYREADTDYARGVNAALDAVMLLDLEQDLQETNRTWGAMADVVCQRLNVERATNNASR